MGLRVEFIGDAKNTHPMKLPDLPKHANGWLSKLWSLLGSLL